MRIPVLDVFAGPGGLGEGFSRDHGDIGFDVCLSIEKDPDAHRTLTLRSFFREFDGDTVPEKYYRYIRGEGLTVEDLKAAYPEQWARAADKAKLAELGEAPFSRVSRWIRRSIDLNGQWVMIGGPPCQAYSTIGRSRMAGSKDFETDQRHTLYREYLKIVAAFQPPVFVMENVKGILSSWHREERIFARILQDLSDPWKSLTPSDRKGIKRPSTRHSYRIFSFSTPAVWEEQLAPADYLIESEKYGVPQNRHRVILLGIRDDFHILPPTLEPAGGPVTVKDVLMGLPAIRSRLSRGEVNYESWFGAIGKGQDLGVFGDEQPDGLPERIGEVLNDGAPHLDAGARFISGS